MPPIYTIGKQERLKSRKQLDELFEKGQVFSQPPFRISYRFSNEDVSALKFGVGVSARHFKKAVHRNRIKRLIRESWRLQKHPLSELLAQQGRGLWVFVIFTGREMTDFKSVSEAMARTQKKLLKLSSETST